MTTDHDEMNCPYCQSATHIVLAQNVTPDPEIRKVEGAGTFNANGVGIVAFHVPAGERWLVKSISVSSDNVAQTTCKIYDTDNNSDPPSPTTFEDATYVGNGDRSDYPAWLDVEANGWLICRWTGGTAGVQCYARVSYRLWRKGG